MGQALWRDRDPASSAASPDDRATIGQLYRRDGVLVAFSACAGAVSFPLSWAVCASATGRLASPWWNATLGATR